MKFTLSWLKDHLETNVSLSEIIEALNKLGLEVSYYKKVGIDIKNFIAAKVIKIEQHKNADKLKICQVDTGERVFQVVCGAPNLKLDMIGVFASSGTYIPGLDLTLKELDIRGELSSGMLCSEKELEISDNHEGIIHLPLDIKLGSEVASFLGIDDPIIEIEITPNRGDCLGVRGIARDLSAFGLGNLKKLQFVQNKGEFESSVKWKINLPEEKKYLCTKIIGRSFKNLKNLSSPFWMKNRLKAVGQRPISALVDITNYVMLDIGRPLHAYDLKKIKGKELKVRLAKTGEKFEALNGKTYNLHEHMLIISDDIGPDDIAGIMGGERTGIDEKTTEMFLEIAIFSPSSISQTGRDLNLITDARYRFERGLDFECPNWAIHYTSNLIKDICGGKSSYIDCQSENIEQKKIYFNPKLVESLTGLKISEDKISNILLKLGFSSQINNENWLVSVPSWRNDIEGKVDLVEEIIRVYGYENIPTDLLERKNYITKPSFKSQQRKSLYARKILATKGYNEVLTFSFLDTKKAKLFNGGQNNLTLVNPISSELTIMRPSIIPNLIDAVQKNINKGFNNLSFFEVGPVFYGDLPEEQVTVASGIRYGNQIEKDWKNEAKLYDFYSIKLDIFETLKALSCPISNLKIDNITPKYFHPGRSATLKLGKIDIAFFGQINPFVLQELNFKNECFCFEIFIDNIPIKNSKNVSKSLLKYSPFQSSQRDFSFVVNNDLLVKDLINVIKNVEKQIINKISVFDLYKGKNIPEGKKSIALSVELTPKEKTLTDKEIDDLSERIISAVSKQVDGQIRQI